MVETPGGKFLFPSLFYSNIVNHPDSWMEDNQNNLD